MAAPPEQGQGGEPAISRLVSRDLDRGVLCRLDVVSTPVQLLWYVTALPLERARLAWPRSCGS